MSHDSTTPTRGVGGSRLTAGLTAGAASAILGSWAGLLVVVMGHPVPWWLLAAMLLTASAVWAVARRILIRRGILQRRRMPAPRFWKATFPLAATLAGVGVLFGAFADLGAGYYMLEPAGPGGCRAVVRETSFLFSGRGEVYSIGPVGLGWRTGSWTADDGYTPIRSGTYTLRWGTMGDGVLHVSGSVGNPVWPALQDVNCRWE